MSEEVVKKIMMKKEIIFWWGYVPGPGDAVVRIRELLGSILIMAA